MKKIFVLVIFLFALFALGGRVQAINAGMECLNSTYLQEITIFGFNGEDYNLTQVSYCQYGCNNVTNDCNPFPLYNTIYLWGMGIIFILIGLAVMGYAGMGNFRSDKENEDEY